MTLESQKSLFSPETKRKLSAFRRHKIGYYSAILLAALVLASLFSELISNSKPLLIRYNHEWYMPIFNSYTDKTFGGIFDTAADYHDPDTQKEISSGDNWTLWPLNHWDYKSINPNPSLQHPSPPSLDNFLGTDDRGRDLLARLLYGIRVSVGFGVAWTDALNRATV